MFVGELRLSGRLSLVKVRENHPFADLWSNALQDLPRDRVILISLEGHRWELEDSWYFLDHIREKLEELGVGGGEKLQPPVAIDIVQGCSHLTVLLLVMADPKIQMYFAKPQVVSEAAA
jgi:hypothetical protein